MVERRPTRDHTERMLRAAGVTLRTEDAGTPVTIRGELPARRVTVEPAERLEPETIVVPGDFSSAAFPLVAALLVAGSEVRLERVGINPGRIGLLGILTRMGAAVEVSETAAAGLEPVATIVARSGPLKGPGSAPARCRWRSTSCRWSRSPAASPRAETVVTGAGELRHKESDRIATVVGGLRGLGAEIEATSDGFAIAGAGRPARRRPRRRGDHRLAMLGAVAGLASDEGVEVAGFDAAAVSYPGFGSDLAALLG